MFNKQAPPLMVSMLGLAEAWPGLCVDRRVFQGEVCCLAAGGICHCGGCESHTCLWCFSLMGKMGPPCPALPQAFGVHTGELPVCPPFRAVVCSSVEAGPQAPLQVEGPVGPTPGPGHQPVIPLEVRLHVPQ